VWREPPLSVDIVGHVIIDTFIEIFVVLIELENVMVAVFGAQDGLGGSCKSAK
jgi:hypothetical protein